MDHDNAESPIDILDILLPRVSPELLATRNQSQSTPLHWAAMNSHLSTCKKLVLFPAGPGLDLIDIKNSAGRTPLSEAEMAGWDEGAQWFVSVMTLQTDGVQDAEGDADDAIDSNAQEDVEIEIEDAEGGVARTTIGKAATTAP